VRATVGWSWDGAAGSGTPGPAADELAGLLA
jgi:hypothetical protein